MIAASSGTGGISSELPAQTGPETIETDLLGFSRDHERTPTDEPGAEQRRYRNVAARLAQRKCESRIRDGGSREPAVSRKAGEQRMVTQVLSLQQAVRTRTIRVPKPGNADPLPDSQPFDRVAHRFYAPDNLVARNDR